MSNEKIEIGVVTSAVGLKGEVRVKSFAESPERFRKVGKVFLERDGREDGPHEVERATAKGGMVTLKLSGVDDRDAAERLRAYTVYMSTDELEELPENSFYVRDLIGMRVEDSETGEEIGTLKDVLTDRPQDLYVVTLTEGGREIMIPAVDEFIKSVDMESRVIKVRVIEGLI